MNEIAETQKLIRDLLKKVLDNVSNQMNPPEPHVAEILYNYITLFLNDPRSDPAIERQLKKGRSIQEIAETSAATVIVLHIFDGYPRFDDATKTRFTKAVQEEINAKFFTGG